MHSNYIGLPPDGVGKKVLTNKAYILPLNTTSGVSVNSIIQNQSGSVELKVCQISVDNNIINTVYTSELNEGLQLAVGDNIYLKGDIGTPIAVITPTADLSAPMFMYVNESVNVSSDNPFHGQIIDEQGQALIRYADGSQLLDGSGQSKFTQQYTIGSYRTINASGGLDQFSTFVGGSGDITTDYNQAAVKLITDSSSGSFSRISTDKYHIRPTGNSNKTEMLCKCGDVGKTGLVRRWGYFDSNNGYYFEQDGTDVFMCRRTDASGVVVTTRLPRSQWNLDRLDGTGPSKEVLNINYWNRYWMDYFKGTRLRMGIFSKRGTRIACHNFDTANVGVIHGSRVSSLPITFEQINNAEIGSSSEFSVYETYASIEGQFEYPTDFFEGGSNVKTVDSSTWVPLITLRPITNNNHAVAVLKTLSAIAVSANDSTKNTHIKIEVFKDAIVSGGADVWTQKPDSSFEYNKDHMVMIGDKSISEHLINGTGNIDFSKFGNYLTEYILEHQDGYRHSYTLAAKGIFPGVTNSVYGAMTWEEYKLN